MDLDEVDWDTVAELDAARYQSTAPRNVGNLRRVVTIPPIRRA